MDFEAEWLLTLPVFFALGWLAARMNYKKQMAQTQKLPTAYFKGLNFLLDKQPDQAIDALIDVARVDTGTTDLYFTLGHLFAQRGEIARAITVYQSLLERADLHEQARLAALHKLGLVYAVGHDFLHLKYSLGERACFVHHHRVDFRHGIQIIATFE